MSNPILSFSARRRMRSVRTPLLITLYALVLSVIGYFAVCHPFVRETFTLQQIMNGSLGYMGIVLLQFVLILLVAPAMTAGSISGERERQTLDLLMVTNMGPGRLVWGTLLESFAFLALLVMSSLPVLSLTLITGVVSLGQVLVSTAFLLVTALAALSVGLFCSSLLKRTVTATVVSYVALLGIGVVTLLPLFYDVKRIGDLYNAMQSSGVQQVTLDYIPISFALNPGLGLFSMLVSQGSDLTGYLWQFSYTLGNTGTMLHYEWFFVINMGFMLIASLVLIVLSALNMKVKNVPKRGKAHA